MSNDVDTSPLIINAAASPVGVISGYVLSIYWYRPLTVGHMAIVQDENDRDIARFRCEAVDQSQILRVERAVEELNVPTLESGILYIYMRREWHKKLDGGV